MAAELPPGALQSPGPRHSGVKEQAKEQAGAMWSDAKETARSKLAEQKSTAASGMRDLAGALRKAARELEGDPQQMVARMAESAAGGLERLSGTLGSKDIGALLDDAQSFARRQPAAFFACAVAAGFLAVRFLKSGHPEQGRTPYGESPGEPMSSLGMRDGPTNPNMTSL